MTSTVSFKEKLKQAYSVFKWDLKSCAGTMAVYAILSVVFTTIVLTLCLVAGTYSQNTLDNESASRSIEYAVKVFQICASGIIYFMTIVFAIIYTVKVYSYLHNKRKADLYGALPISRIMLFVSKSASAYLFTLVPAMFFLGIIFIISICMGQPIVNEALEIYVKLLLGTLASISAYGLLSVCCGTTLNAVISFIAVCIAYPLSAMFIKGVAGGFFYGSYSGIFKDHFIMNALNPLAAYNGINVIYWLIFSAVCIVASAFLVKNRKAERAQSSFAYYLPCHIIKTLIAFLAGMFLGVLFGSLNVFNYAFAGFAFGFILGSVPAFIICHLIFYKGFSKLIKTSIPLGGLIVAVIAVMAVCNYDIFNYNDFLPDADSVKSAGLIDTEYNYAGKSGSIIKLTKNSAEDFTEKSDVKEIINIHSRLANIVEISSDKKFQGVWYDMLVDNFPININKPRYCIAYKLNSGRVVTRIYTKLPFAEYSYFDDIGTLKILKTKKYTEKYSAAVNAKADDMKISVRTDSYMGCESEDTKQSKKDFEKVTEAFKKDLAADKSDWSTLLAPLDNSEIDGYEYYLSSFYPSTYGIEAYKELYPDSVCLLRVSVEEKADIEAETIFSIFSAGLSSLDNGSTEEEYLIPKSYTNTIEALKEIGVLDADNNVKTDSIYYKVINSY